MEVEKMKINMDTGGNYYYICTVCKNHANEVICISDIGVRNIWVCRNCIIEKLGV